MKSGKIVSFDDYRAERHGMVHKNRGSDSGSRLPSADRLWKLLDRNISIAIWRQQNCGQV